MTLGITALTAPDGMDGTTLGSIVPTTTTAGTAFGLTLGFIIHGTTACGTTAEGTEGIPITTIVGGTPPDGE